MAYKGFIFAVQLGIVMSDYPKIEYTV